MQSRTMAAERGGIAGLEEAARDACDRFFGPKRNAPDGGRLGSSPYFGLVHQAIDRFVAEWSTTARSAPAWSDPNRDILADLKRTWDLVESMPKPVATRIEADDLALAYMQVAFARADYDDALAALLSLPIVVNNDLPRGGWRAVDGDGNAIEEGRVFE